MTAWRRLDDVPEGDAARVWLYATARRVIANQRRSKRRRVALRERLALEAASVAPESPEREESLVHEALHRLGPRDREVLLLAEWEGLSPAQIAAVLGCLTVTVRGRLHRARKRFRAAFQELLTPNTQVQGGSMHKSQSIQALRRANPRARDGFVSSVEAATHAVRSQIDASTEEVAVRHSSRRGLGVAAGASLAAAAAAALFLAVGQPGGSPGVANAAAAVKEAVTVTAASAERSGTAVVRITHDGRLWAGTTIRWHGDDVAVRGDAPDRTGKVGSMLLVVNGTLYGTDPEVEGGWLDMGSPANIDPDSGTTPAEYLAAVREDVGGVTLRRFTRGMSGLTSRELADGSTVYSGTVTAGLIARRPASRKAR